MISNYFRKAVGAPNRLSSSGRQVVAGCASQQRSGLTLTELLVVIAVLVVVTSILAPLLTSSLEGREIREAARQVNAYFQQAQARARELGRPVGVVIRRSEFVGDPTMVEDPQTQARQDYGYQLSLAEEPPPFRGFLPSDRAYLANGSAYLELAGPPVGSAINPAIYKMVQPNDSIRFNLRGGRYRILGVFELTPNQKTLFPKASIRVQLEGGATPELNRIAAPVPFEVFRRPKQVASTPMELPTGTALIMDLSGVGMDSIAGQLMGMTNTGEESQQQVIGIANPRQKYIGLTEFKRPSGLEMQNYDPTGNYLDYPLTIMFSPDGSIDRVYRVMPPLEQLTSPNFPPKRPQDKIFLFIGKDALTTWENYRDTANLWIVLDPANGLTTTAIHTVDSQLFQDDVFQAFQVSTMPQKLPYIARSRQLAATGQSMGGQ